ncbi:MAG: hypothetical protein QOI16_4310 [Pseudonocardiales bacterium]|nr:hypothetical protein [Pseudonocardiales bacterium]
MEEPIANAWKAIHNRMQQIMPEKSAGFEPAESATARLSTEVLGPSAFPSG